MMDMNAQLTSCTRLQLFMGTKTDTVNDSSITVHGYRLTPFTMLGDNHVAASSSTPTQRTLADVPVKRRKT
jgi:hypothetical protein